MQIVFVDFDNKIDWFEFDGNFAFIDDIISDNLDIFDSIAHECEVTALSHFIADYVDENPYEFGLGGKWFPVEDGLNSADAIIRYLNSPQATGKSKSTARKVRKMGAWVTEEFQNLHQQLTYAAKLSRNARFKLVPFKIVEGYPVVAMAPKVLPYP